jgi:hypothetical protein
MSRWAALAVAVLMLVAPSAGAAPKGPTTPVGDPIGGPQPPRDTTVDSLVITAPPAQAPIDSIGAFVGAVSEQTANGRLARWDRKVCPGVIGLKPPHGQILIDRIAVIAVSVGLEPGDPGCKANMIIVATDDGQALARSVVDGNPRGFARYESGATRGKAALKDFVETPRAVRWWHVTRTIGADGQRYGRDEDGPGSITVRSLGRLSATTRDDFDRVIIMVDVTRIGVIRFEALADYIAMVGLAQIDPDADAAGVTTILNLFADRDRGRDPAVGLTEWDLAYLQSLYSTKREVIRGSRQERDISRGMEGRLAPPPPQDDADDE